MNQADQWPLYRAFLQNDQSMSLAIKASDLKEIYVIC